MRIAWHEPVRSWALKPEGHLDERLCKSLTVRRWDPIQRVYWAPEIVWDEIAKWSWPAGSSPTSRYAGPGGVATGRDGIILPFPPLDPNTPVYEPLPHQWAGIQGMIDGHFLCGDSMGLGKTAMALWAYQHLLCMGVAEGLVVVCTKRKVEDWQEDFERFLYRKPMQGELHVLNYDRTYRGQYSEPVMAALRTQPTVMVADEVHHLSGVETNRFGACMALGQYAVRRWGLSGTPVRNRPESFHPIYRWVTGAQVERKDFLKKYCHMDGQRITGYRAMALKHLHPIFRTFGIARTKEEVLTLPPARLVPVRVPLRGRQKALYNEMRLSLRATVKTATGDQVVSARGQMFTQLTRLLQIASSPRLIGEDCPDGDLAKLEVLDELVAESGDQKILVWDSHPQTLEELAARFPGHSPVVMHGGRTVKQNEDAKKGFQTDPTCRMACISLLAFGEGVNLQAATVAIFHSLVWNYEKIIQAMARIHRIGQDKPCSMYFLLGRDTLEEHVFGTLETKHGMATSIIRGKAEGWEWDWNQIDRDLLLRLLAKAA